MRIALVRPPWHVMVALGLLAACVSCSAPSAKKDSQDKDKPVTKKDKQAAKKDTAGSKARAKKSKPRRFFPGKRLSEDQVLRHAVFFSFKDTSKPDDIQQVVDAFRALPTKVKTITDFQWGLNNSPEGKNEGLTHAFLLTFQDEAGRKTYLPHDEHKAFGDVLRPHMKSVFVIDYWATPPKSKLEKELKHAVFFQFKDSASDDDVARVEKAFAELPSKIEAIKGFEWGHNNSPERHYRGITHCFMLTFDSEEGRDAYLPHPAHEALVKLLGPLLEKVIVVDFWAQK